MALQCRQILIVAMSFNSPLNATAYQLSPSYRLDE